MQQMALLWAAGRNWSVVKAMRCAQDHLKSDERILGDGGCIHFGLNSVKRGEKIAKAEHLGLVED